MKEKAGISFLQQYILSRFNTISEVFLTPKTKYNFIGIPDDYHQKNDCKPYVSVLSKTMKPLNKLAKP